MPPKCPKSVLFWEFTLQEYLLFSGVQNFETWHRFKYHHVFVCRVELLINCWLSDVSPTVNLYSVTSPGRVDETFSDCINFQKIVPILTEGDQALSGLFAALIPTFKIIQTSRTQGVHPILRKINVQYRHVPPVTLLFQNLSYFFFGQVKKVETCPKKCPCACDEATKYNVPVLFLFSLWRVLSREGLLSLSRQACLLCGWSHLLALEMWIYDKGSNLAARWQNLNAGHRHTCAPTLIHLTTPFLLIKLLCDEIMWAWVSSAPSHLSQLVLKMKLQLRVMQLKSGFADRAPRQQEGLVSSQTGETD